MARYDEDREYGYDGDDEEEGYERPSRKPLALMLTLLVVAGVGGGAFLGWKTLGPISGEGSSSASSQTPAFELKEDFGSDNSSSVVELAQTPDPLDEIDAALASIQYDEGDAEVFADYAQLVRAGGGLAYATQAAFDEHLESYRRIQAEAAAELDAALPASSTGTDAGVDNGGNDAGTDDGNGTGTGTGTGNGGTGTDSGNGNGNGQQSQSGGSQTPTPSSGNGGGSGNAGGDIYTKFPFINPPGTHGYTPTNTAKETTYGSLQTGEKVPWLKAG